MASEKIIEIKKPATLMGLVVTIIVFIGIFTIMFTWLATNSNQSGVTVDSRYNESYTRVLQQQNELNSTVGKIQSNLDDITEADSSLQVAWNGMQFLGTAILASKDFVDVTLGSFSAVSDIASSSGISPSVILLITIGVISFVVFLVLSNLKGEPKMID
jgi:hypothetical protein